MSDQSHVVNINPWWGLLGSLCVMAFFLGAIYARYSVSGVLVNNAPVPFSVGHK